MPLRALRFAGDPDLEQCLADPGRRLRAPEEGLMVLRVQAALQDLGLPVGLKGLDGNFGADTGTAVSQFKAGQGLQPTDPVVGPGTMGALDAAFAVDPPELDPAFREFSPLVLHRRVDPMIAAVLAELISAPLNSWRHMTAMRALAPLNSGELTGIVAFSRIRDLRQLVLDRAAPVQAGGVGARLMVDTLIDQLSTAPGRPVESDTLGTTVSFHDTAGATFGLIAVSDSVFRGKARITLSATNASLPVSLTEVLVHELTHFRNQPNADALLATPDGDPGTYVDPALSVALSVNTEQRSGRMLSMFVEEFAARHVHWHVRKELDGDPLAQIRLLPEELATAVITYLVRHLALFRSNGYLENINKRPDGGASRFRQAALWLRRARAYQYSTRPEHEGVVQARIEQAAAFCDEQATVGSDEAPSADGLFPLAKDFP
ncbi:peptidoglycan-binding domain-containing protein [Corallococcus carmarthensis]|uniref:peptidoglycan-binding domain-containing protein n=1 Tax=Corallococcus carmarthensis TaxID=2316728 RepID=UPI0011C4A04E|nr:peptidoglycan-binding domain-containing protein [Corallococcus carmarthensis]